MLNTRNNKLYLLLLVLFSLQLKAQLGTFSPYSRYGIGTMNSQGLVKNISMAGTGVANFNDTLAPLQINLLNPASLSSLYLTTFEVAANNTYSKFTSNDATHTRNNPRFAYFSLAVPIKRFAGFAFGMMPYSDVGYKITDPQEVTNIGTVKTNYSGSGGLNNAYISFGFKPFRNVYTNYMKSIVSDEKRNILILKNVERFNCCKEACDTLINHRSEKFLRSTLSSLSFGATANYLFGSFQNSSDVLYPIGLNVFNTKVQKETQARGFQFKLGAQIDFTINYKRNKHDSILDTIPNPDLMRMRCTNELIHLKNPMHVSLGYTFNPVSKLAAKYNTLAYNYTLGANDFVVVKDTVINTSNAASEIILPLAHVIGAQFKYGTKFTALVDVGIDNWSKFKLLNNTNTLKNSKSFGLGLQYVPNRNAGSGEYLKRINYRAGVKYSDGFLELKSTKISSLTIAGGLGFPLGQRETRNLSMFNIGFEYIQVGSVKNNLVQENHYKVTLGLTLNDRWFKKYVFD